MQKVFVKNFFVRNSRESFQKAFPGAILSEVFFDEQNLRKTNVVSKSLLFTFQRDIVLLV